MTEEPKNELQGVESVGALTMNLKQAARRLGIHYQTAYKLVRSGRLAAIRVGGGYDISEAALARYLAEREAMRRVPPVEDAPGAAAQVDGRDARKEVVEAAHAALDATTLSGRAVVDVVAEGLSRVLGDLAVVRPLSRDGRKLLPGAVHHPDARRRSIATTEIEAFPKPVSEGHAGVAVTTRAPVFVPHVAQDRLRAQTRPELVQYLDEASVHSLICVPAVHDGEVLAVLTVTRDTPGRPYTREDVELVTQLAHVVAAALARSSAASEAWRRRETLMHDLASIDAADADAVGHALHDDRLAELVCDAQGTVVAANPAAARLAGVPVGQLVGRRLQELACVADQPAEVALIERLLVGELTYADSHRAVVTGDRRAPRLVVHHGVVRTAAGEPHALVVVAHPLVEAREPDEVPDDAVAS